MFQWRSRVYNVWPLSRHVCAYYLCGFLGSQLTDRCFCSFVLLLISSVFDCSRSNMLCSRVFQNFDNVPQMNVCNIWSWSCSVTATAWKGNHSQIITKVHLCFSCSLLVGDMCLGFRLLRTAWFRCGNRYVCLWSWTFQPAGIDPDMGDHITRRYFAVVEVAWRCHVIFNCLGDVIPWYEDCICGWRRLTRLWWFFVVNSFQNSNSKFNNGHKKHWLYSANAKPKSDMICSLK